jgi:hypothetical protein
LRGTGGKKRKDGQKHRNRERRKTAINRRERITQLKDKTDNKETIKN